MVVDVTLYPRVSVGRGAERCCFSLCFSLWFSPPHISSFVLLGVNISHPSGICLPGLSTSPCRDIGSKYVSTFLERCSSVSYTSPSTLLQRRFCSSVHVHRAPDMPRWICDSEVIAHSLDSSGLGTSHRLVLPTYFGVSRMMACDLTLWLSLGSGCRIHVVRYQCMENYSVNNDEKLEGFCRNSIEPCRNLPLCGSIDKF